ncbi:class II aldolase/adducin family protein [Lachnospiraceae bacterium ZAX-1]
MDSMEGFIAISNYAGMREDLVQAGGGNSSAKCDDGTMYIKASGYKLSDVNFEQGYSVVNCKKIEDYFIDRFEKNIVTCSEKELLAEALVSGSRSSIETFLHAFGKRFTLHTHPTVVNIIACRENWDIILRKLFPTALLVEYTTPGIELAKKTYEEIKRKNNQFNSIQDVELIFLQNHGLIVSEETSIEVIEKTESVLRTIEKYLKLDFKAYHDSTTIYHYLKSFEMQTGIVHYSNDVQIQKAAASGMWRYDFCPDCTVYCGKRPLVISNDDIKQELSKYLQSDGIPVVIWYKNSCFICGENSSKVKEIESVLSFSAQVFLADSANEIQYLTDEEQSFLINWDAEKYRRSGEFKQ